MIVTGVLPILEISVKKPGLNRPQPGDGFSESIKKIVSKM